MDAVPRSPHPIRLVVTDDCERSRPTVLLRLLLAIPHVLWIVLWGTAVFTLTFVIWLAVLFERRAPRTLHGFVAAYVRYATHLVAYLTLAADPYPGFTGRPGYPVDVEVDPPALQGRWGAAFRLVLAIPALIMATALVGGGGGSWSSSFGGAVWIVAFFGWFACLARGRMPRGLRDFSVYAIGYSAQAYGYLMLLTDRYPSSDPALVRPAELPAHPVRVTVTDSLQRGRLVVLFRLLLLLPHIVWFLLWGLVVIPAAFAAWVTALAIGRVPRPLQRFLAAYVRYGAHVSAFGYLVGGPFPGFTGTPGSYPVDITIEPAARQRRLVTLARAVLVLPAAILASAYGTVVAVVAVLGWFAALFTGRMPEGLRNIGAACIRYNAQASAYALLVTDRYPYAAPFLEEEERDEQLGLFPDGETA